MQHALDGGLILLDCRAKRGIVELRVANACVRQSKHGKKMNETPQSRLHASMVNAQRVRTHLLIGESIGHIVDNAHHCVRYGQLGGERCLVRTSHAHNVAASCERANLGLGLW